MGFFERARTSLDGIESPTRVRLRGHVATPAILVSPMTDRRAAHFHWTFTVNHKPTILPLVDSILDATRRGGGDPFNDEVELELLATVIVGDELLIGIGDKTLVVPTRTLVVRFLATGEPAPVDRSLPPELVGHEVSRATGSSALYYVEHALFLGDEVAIVATIEPLAKERGGYRSAGGFAPDFGARPDLGPMLLEELLA